MFLLCFVQLRFMQILIVTNKLTLFNGILLLEFLQMLWILLYLTIQCAEFLQLTGAHLIGSLRKGNLRPLPLPRISLSYRTNLILSIHIFSKVPGNRICSQKAATTLHKWWMTYLIPSGMFPTNKFGCQWSYSFLVSNIL